jgi:predicted adenine nucleotide alpha hydrolase (AANH) superfamily ATPase
MRGFGPLKRLATLNPKEDILFVKPPQGQHNEEERARACDKCIDSRQTKKAAQQTMRDFGPLKRLATLNPKEDILFVKPPEGQHHEEERAGAQEYVLI